MLRTTSICAALLLAAACAADDNAEVSDVQTEDTLTDQTRTAAPAQENLSATAQLLDAQGQQVGTATLEEGEGGVRIDLDLTGLPAGTHGFHIHQTGECTPPDFSSAGGHFNPTNAQHGLENPQGPHAGDMQNFDVNDDGSARFATDNDRVTLSPGTNSLLDTDGSALVIHAVADDNVTDPSGNSGDRIACGVITAR
jgi:superoxide dismutase, Cu-Zn family